MRQVRESEAEKGESLARLQLCSVPSYPELFRIKTLNLQDFHDKTLSWETVVDLSRMLRFSTTAVTVQESNSSCPRCNSPEYNIMTIGQI